MDGGDFSGRNSISALNTYFHVTTAQAVAIRKKIKGLRRKKTRNIEQIADKGGFRSISVLVF